MESLLVVVAADPAARERAFREGVALAHELQGASPRAMVGAGNARGAVFARANGSGAGFARDTETGSWLLAVGTWLHERGPVAGAEADLLRRYLEAGAERLSLELDGFFAIAIGDGRSGDVVLLTDPLGSCHLFAREVGGATVVSTSSLLLAGIAETSAIDPLGLQEFLSTGILYETRTLHAGVRKIPGATVERIHDGAPATSARTWGVSHIRADELDGDDAVDALHAALVRGARRVQALPHRRVCADLTGGYDSRAVIAGLLCAGVPFSTTVTGDSTDVDVRVAERVARAGRFDHHWIPTRRPTRVAEVRAAAILTDGAYDAVEYAAILAVHRELSAKFDVSLNGSGGEVGRGRWWEQLPPHTGARTLVDPRQVALRRFAAAGVDPSLFPGTDASMAEHFTGMVSRASAGFRDLPNTVQMNWLYVTLRMQSWQGRIASTTNRLWPCLSPFLLRDVLRVLLAMTTKIRSRSLVVRRFLAAFQPVIAVVPSDNGYPPIPFGWRTAHRFGGLPLYFGGRVLAKAARIAGVKPALPEKPAELPPRFHLQLDPELAEVLAPSSLALASVVDSDALRGFLARASARDFSAGEEWNRVLSVELAMRELARARDAARRTVRASPADRTSSSITDARTES